MKDDSYENIARIIVRANELRKKEEISAKNDYDTYLGNISNNTDMTLNGPIGSSAEYSAYLGRAGNAENTLHNTIKETQSMKRKNNLFSKVSDILSKMNTAGLQLENARNEYEAEYEKQRDEMDDYYYDLKNSMQEKYNASKKKTSSSKKRSYSSSAKKKTTAEKVKDPVTFDDMPVFSGHTNSSEGLAGDVYANAFRQKAMNIVGDGSKKADSDEVNYLLKLARSYGASDEYLRWLSEVCGY